MRNYDDYQLDEMENAAVNKSKNLKRAGVIGAAVLGVGGTAAYGASQLNNPVDAEETTELTSDDLLAGAEAGVDNLETPAEPVEAAPQQEVHVYHHQVQEQEQPAAPADDLDIKVEESGVIFDNDGNIARTVDAGTIDGKDFMVIDNDLNGRGDVLAYDANGNGRFEADEVVSLDNRTYEMGQGKEFNLYAENERGEVVRLNDDLYYADNDPIGDIHNDFDDEKTGDYYRGDLAENNRDYVNDEADQYSASMERESGDLYAQVDEKYDDYEEPQDYGYTEPGDDLAYDGGADSFDDPGVYDA